MKSKRSIKGVSEVVGYLLVFSIVVTIVSVIYASGMPMVERTKETSAFQSMETAFVTLQSTMKKVAFAQSPVRTTTLNMHMGSISAHKNAGNITIETDVSSNTTQFGSVEYVLGARRIRYENGAVIECSPGGTIIISDPLIYFMNTSGNAHLFISVINASGTFSAGGGVAEMCMRQEDPKNDTKVIRRGSEPAVSYVNISVNSVCAYAWVTYLEDEAEKARLNVLSDNPGPSATSGYVNVSDAGGFNLTLVTHNVSVS